MTWEFYMKYEWETRESMIEKNKSQLKYICLFTIVLDAIAKGEILKVGKFSKLNVSVSYSARKKNKSTLFPGIKCTAAHLSRLLPQTNLWEQWWHATFQLIKSRNLSCSFTHGNGSFIIFFAVASLSLRILINWVVFSNRDNSFLASL